MGEPEAIARRAWRRTALIGSAGAVVGVVVGILLGAGESGLVAVLSVVGFGVSLGGLAGTFSLLVTTIRTSSAMQQPMAGASREDRRAVATAMKTGTPIEPLESELAHRAYDHARLLGQYQPLALGQFLLLYLGISGAQFPRLVADDASGPGFSRLICGGLLIVAAVATSFLVRATVQARRYTRTVTAAADGAPESSRSNPT